MGHAGAAEGLDQGFLDDTVFDVEGQLAGTLLGGTPAHTVGQTGNVADLFGLYPFAFFRNRSRTVVGTLGDLAHLLDFVRTLIRTTHELFSLGFVFT